jgi:hypothetical protein
VVKLIIRQRARLRSRRRVGDLGMQEGIDARDATPPTPYLSSRNSGVILASIVDILLTPGSIYKTL